MKMCDEYTKLEMNERPLAIREDTLLSQVKLKKIKTNNILLVKVKDGCVDKHRLKLHIKNKSGLYDKLFRFIFISLSE